MKRSLFLSIIFTIIFSCWSNAAEKNDFETLVEFSNLESVPDSILSKAEGLVYKLLETQKYLPEDPITYYFGIICLKSESENGVSSYIQYLKDQEGSAEEELSFRFEPIFFRRPNVVLSEIRNEKPEIQKKLLDHIGWGFLNNTPSVTKDNYEQFFFEKNPEVKKIYKIYKPEIDVIFQGIEEYFVWLKNLKK